MVVWRVGALLLVSGGRVFGSFVNDGFLYFCGYIHLFVAGKYFPMVFVAKYDIGEGRLVWFSVVEDVRGRAYSILVKDNYVYVSGLLANVGGGLLFALAAMESFFGAMLLRSVLKDCLI